MKTYKNKTLASLLALLLGSLGMHRFYLHGGGDRWAWTHVAAWPLAWMLSALFPNLPAFFAGMPIWISGLAGVLAALVLGLSSDEKWDARFHQGEQVSRSAWPLALVLVSGVGAGAVGLIWVIARSFDLLFTGGAYG